MALEGIHVENPKIGGRNAGDVRGSGGVVRQLRLITQQRHDCHSRQLIQVNHLITKRPECLYSSACLDDALEPELRGCQRLRRVRSRKLRKVGMERVRARKERKPKKR